MKIRFFFLLPLLISLVPTAPSLAAGDRFALVIGNAKYPDADAPLKEPINDARAVADELKRDGFSVELGENLTGDAMRRAFDKLYGKIKPGSVALVFFSGFGIQSARQSYLLPVDAQIWTESDVRRDGFSLETVLGELNTRGAGVKIALVDASRRNPFERRFRSFSAGLTPVIAPNGTLVMYSAALASVVSDAGGDRSLFVQELLKEIRVPDLMAEETLNRTKMGVTRASRGEQVPWISSSLAEDFSFIPGAGGSRPATPPPAPPAAPAVVANNPPADSAAAAPAPAPPPPAAPVAAPAPAPRLEPQVAEAQER
ncbi:caspase family protein, partial [Bradyrhizobium sp. IC3195]|uniref:caspase family protein n=1 Tax=Bradyrhizobium sp. IC3195 TaxID=2793804 RepID=UPI001CD582FC